MENNVIKIKKQSKVYTNYNNNSNYNTSKNYLQNLLYQGISLRRTNLHMHEDENSDDDEDDDWDDCGIDNKKKKDEKIEIIPKIIDLNFKESLMKMINTQEFIEGYWEENEYIIKDKYQNVYNSLKQLKINNINDKIIMTILVIFYINKEQQKYLDELLMIIKKAKIFILKKTNESMKI